MSATVTTLRPRQRPSLAQTIAMAGSQQWSPEALDAHKHAELKAAPPPHRLYKHRPVITDLLLGAQDACILSAGIAFAFFIASVAALYSPQFERMWFLPADGVRLVLAISLAVGLAALGCTIALRALGRMCIRAPAHWVRMGLVEYLECDVPHGAPYPAEAARLVQTIEALVPRSQFTVEVLKQGTVTLDPVLWFHDPEDALHRPILVWNKQGEIVEPPG